MKLKTFIEIILHFLLLGVVFPLLISSNRLELFYLGILGALAYVFVYGNRVINFVKRSLQ